MQVMRLFFSKGLCRIKFREFAEVTRSVSEGGHPKTCRFQISLADAAGDLSTDHNSRK